MALSTLLMLGGGTLAAYSLFGPPSLRFADAGPQADARRAEQDAQQRQLLTGAALLGGIGITARVLGA